MNTALEMDSSQQELHRLLLWAKDNEADWYRICNPACYDPNITYLTDLVERLYRAKLYTVAFFVIYANHIREGVDWAITRTPAPAPAIPTRLVFDMVPSPLCT